jgi:hypothetical protein
MRTKCRPALAAALLFLSGSVSWAQQATTANSFATRPELEAQVKELKQQLGQLDPDKNEDEIKTLQYELSVAESRLADGDFQPSDALQLDVQGMPQFTGTFNLDRNRDLILPTVDPISMRGVLYSEAEEAVTDGLKVYLRDPQVRVTVTKRIAIVGGISSPGFYDIPPQSTVSQAIMLAGGPAGNAKLNQAEFRRLGDAYTDPYGNIAFTNVSLVELGVRSGDELYVPPGGSGLTTTKIIGGIATAAGLVFLFTRIFDTNR